MLAVACNQLKNAWKQQANYLNSLPTVVEFNILPERLQLVDLNPLNHIFLKQEYNNIKPVIVSRMTTKIPPNIEKRALVLMPQEIRVEICVLQDITYLHLMIFYLFGSKKVEGFSKTYETVCGTRASQTTYLHFASTKRLQQVL